MEKNKILNIIIVFLVLILIGVGFIVLIDKYGAPEKYTYEGPNGMFTFTKMKQGTVTFHNIELSVTNQLVNARLGINDDRQIIIPFRYGPADVKDIQVSNDSVNIIDHFNKMLNEGRGIYLTYDPYEKSDIVLPVVEIGRVIGTEKYGVFQIPTEAAYSKAYGENNTRKVVTCNQTDWIQGVIHFTLGEETKVFNYPNYPTCIVIEGKTYEDILKATDALVYNTLGVLDTDIPQDDVIGEGVHLKEYGF